MTEEIIQMFYTATINSVLLLEGCAGVGTQTKGLTRTSRMQLKQTFNHIIYMHTLQTALFNYNNKPKRQIRPKVMK